MVGTIAMAAVMVSAALSSAALPALAPITEIQPEHNDEITTVGFVKKECSADTLRFVENATNNNSLPPIIRAINMKEIAHCMRRT